MKTMLLVGTIWAGICVIILWLIHRFHRRHISRNNRQDFAPQISVKTQSRKSITKLTGEDGVKIISTDLSLSPKTGEITSPSGEVELESYERSKTAGTIKKTLSGKDIVDE